MEYTKNYQLPSWVKEDRIRMEDFNDMTGKLDTALGDLAAHTGLQLLQSWEVEKTFRNTLIDLNDIDWVEWKKIYIDIIPAAGTSANTTVCYSSVDDVIGKISTKWTRLILCPYGYADMPIMIFFWGAEVKMFRTDLMTFGGIGRFQVIGDTLYDQVAAGTKIIVRGERI